MYLSNVSFETELWEEIGYSEAERLTFKPMLVTEDGFTDELLRQHTKEAENLNAKFETMKHILEVQYSREYRSKTASQRVRVLLTHGRKRIEYDCVETEAITTGIFFVANVRVLECLCGAFAF